MLFSRHTALKRTQKWLKKIRKLKLYLCVQIPREGVAHPEGQAPRHIRQVRLRLLGRRPQLSTRAEPRGRHQGGPRAGRQFNRQMFCLRFCLKNRVRFRFDSETLSKQPIF